MARSRVIFKLVDYLFHIPQNYKRFSNVTIEKDIIYDNNYPYICKGDLYYDKRYQVLGKYPVIVNIHGGGFVGGDKRHRKSISSYYANKGWFVYNINYRLSPAYPFPSANIDCMKALNFLKSLEDRFNLDLNRVIVTGDSAGGYFATYLVASSTNKELRAQIGMPDPEVSIAGLMSFSGLYNIKVALQSKLPFDLTRNIAESFLGMEINKDFSNLEDYPYLAETSPSNFVNADWCPVFLSYAEKDFLCKGQGEALIEKLTKLGVEVFSHNSVKTIDNHCYHLEWFKNVSKECFKKADSFLKKIKSIQT